jgi:hypothetical protein
VMLQSRSDIALMRFPRCQKYMVVLNTDGRGAIF